MTSKAHLSSPSCTPPVGSGSPSLSLKLSLHQIKSHISPKSTRVAHNSPLISSFPSLLWSQICSSSSAALWHATHHQLIRHVLPHKMELSESVQAGLRCLADPATFDRTGFQVLVDTSFQSLLSSRGDPAVLGEPAAPLFCLPWLLPVPSCADVQKKQTS